VERWQGWGTYDEERGRDLLASLLSAEFGLAGSSAQIAFQSVEVGTLVGDAMLRIAAGGKSAEIGYTIAPKYQQLGFGSEGVKALLDYAVPRLGLELVEASTLEDNEASIALLLSLGFQEVPQTRPGEKRFGMDTVRTNS
jgi:RimJ/RimL family protein N-acetyltransferase